MEPQSGDQGYSPEKQGEKFSALPPEGKLNAIFAVMGDKPLEKGTVLQIAGINLDAVNDDAAKGGIEQFLETAKIEREGSTLYGFSVDKQKEIETDLDPDIAVAARRQINKYWRERLIKRPCPLG